MSKIILADGGNDRDIREGTLSRREQKQYERVNRQAVSIGQLPPLVARIVDPAFTVMHQSIRETDLALVALKEIIAEKLNITDEEFEMKFDEVVERSKQTPNSPALEEAQEASQGDVKPLREVPQETEEQSPRRLVEG